MNLKPWFRWNRQWITPKPQREANFKKTKRNHSWDLLGAARQPAPLFFMLFLQIFISILQLIVGAVQNGMLGAEMFQTAECIFGHSERAPQENQQSKHHEKEEELPCHSSSCLNTVVVDIGLYWALDLIVQDHSCNTIWLKARKKHDLSHGFGRFCHLFPMAMSLALLFKLILSNQRRAISMGHVQLVHEKIHPLTRTWFRANVLKVQSVGTCTSTFLPSITHCWIQRILPERCLILPAPCRIDSCRALGESVKRKWSTTGSCQKHEAYPQKKSSHKVDTSACGSASHELKLMTLWILLLPNKKHPFNMCMPLLVDLLRLWLDDQSESLKLSKIKIQNRSLFSNVLVQAEVSPTPSKCLMSSSNTPQAFWDVEVMSR